MVRYPTQRIPMITKMPTAVSIDVSFMMPPEN